MLVRYLSKHIIHKQCSKLFYVTFNTATIFIVRGLSFVSTNAANHKTSFLS